jgi:hypothetical protein
MILHFAPPAAEFSTLLCTTKPGQFGLGGHFKRSLSDCARLQQLTILFPPRAFSGKLFVGRVEWSEANEGARR